MLTTDLILLINWKSLEGTQFIFFGFDVISAGDSMQICVITMAHTNKSVCSKQKQKQSDYM